MLALLPSLRAQEGPRWREVAGARWTDLIPSGSGKTGFSLLSPASTGVDFTNVLDEASSAANRVLEDGSGVAVGDFDGDGRPDIFLCSLTGSCVLYRNLDHWKFEEVSARAGISTANEICRGAVFSDVNGDGRLDLLISTLGHGVLCYINEGNGHFTNTTAAAGTASRFGSMTLALADIDGNGTLDLYVTNYRTDDIRDRSRIDVRRVNGQIEIAPWLQDRVKLTPEGFIEFGEPDVLYLNDGAGRFTEVSWTGGQFLDERGRPLESKPLDWGLSASFRDLNGDGAPISMYAMTIGRRIEFGSTTATDASVPRPGLPFAIPARIPWEWTLPTSTGTGTWIALSSTC